ncbi:MAG: hypothetical protein J0I54_15985 [Bosea sp.]|uniref:PGN_0703 family putative restriction endonuclease n=1 Tax=unclassified Bosea (in: a-proteobacteria) TaxID=2653178 RepID=UPI00096913E9|nr:MULTISPECIES: hypothetical protein [unclassified Bosea (in: a-proteobacteria)]MBN9458133.1 hypothetical protein [Bosea sp. (in: a-proteobacteria)]OJV10629.1 MAG: hypothetical protein BGO20_07885 [Bosea sp. 67-29]
MPYDLPDTFPHVPLLPEELLRRHHIFEPLDHRFRSAARLLQSIWRQDRELPIGSYKVGAKRKKLGSRISPAAARAGANFMLPAIAWLVRRELAYREPAAMIDEARLYGNLLSSMPMAFNVFGLLKLDLAFASRVLAELFPDLSGAKVHAVLFEHSPGRGDPALTGDHSAFDVFLHYETPAGRKGFIAIETKYTESCQEPVPAIRPRYNDLADVSGLFVEPQKPALRTNPYQQLFREHLLAQAMLMRADFDEGRFVVIAPRLNTLVATAVASYQAELKPAGEDQVGFASITLEDTIVALAMAGEEEYAARLYRRYADFSLVDGELNLFWAGDGPIGKAEEATALAGPLKLLPGGRT